MMKKYLSCAFFLWPLLNISAQTQQNPSRWAIGVTAGPAFPVGTLAGYHSPIQSSGGVSIGESAELSCEYWISRSFSVAMAFSGQLDHGAGIPRYLRMEQEDQSTKSNTGLKSDWQMARVLSGGMYTIPLSKRQGPALFVRLLAGIGKTRTPDYSFFSDNPGMPVSITEPGASLPWTFSYEPDAGIKWDLSRRCTFVTYAGYSGSRPSKEVANVITSCPFGGCTGPHPPSSESFMTGTIFLRAGLGFWL